LVTPMVLLCNPKDRGRWDQGHWFALHGHGQNCSLHENPWQYKSLWLWMVGIFCQSINRHLQACPILCTMLITEQLTRPLLRLRLKGLSRMKVTCY
jgi:hypothetical protein